MSLLLCSHGTASPAGQAAVARLVAAVAEARPWAAVRAAFVDVEHPDVPTALAAVDEPEGDDGGDAGVTVVPLLLSAGYHVYVDLTQAVAASARPTRLAGALGPDPRLAEILARRLADAGLRDDDVVVLAAAGSSDERAVLDCARAAALLAERLGREVSVGFLSAATPSLAEAITAARRPRRRLALATYLLAPGYFADLAARHDADLVSAPLALPAHTPAELVDIVLDRADATPAEAAAEDGSGLGSQP